MENEIFFTKEVSAEDQKMRLDKFLACQISQLSRAQIQRLIAGGNVSLEDVYITDNSFKVRQGDSYQVFVPLLEEAVPQAENIELDIVYEDEDIVVVNKPAGMVVHPGAGVFHGTLVNALLYHCRDSLSGIGGVKRPGIVHRIDKDTSGLLVVAKNDAAHHFLSEQFAEHSIERTYMAVVYGVINPMSGRIEGHIGRSRFDRKKMAIVENGGKFAATNYKTLEIFGQAVSLVQCNLETGRTHQIRVHLSSLGHALVGDQVYEKNKKTGLKIPTAVKDILLSFPRQALHAKTLGFIHPRSRVAVHFDSELPSDMTFLLQQLRTF